MKSCSILVQACLVMALTSSPLVACSKTIDDHGSEFVDFSNAKQVVASIFFAAKYGKSAHLASLCDPQGHANRYALRVCSETVGGQDWPLFVKQFSLGHLIGEARISGDRAMINFVFGPQGTEPETMELVRRGAKWHLLKF